MLGRTAGRVVRPVDPAPGCQRQRAASVHAGVALDDDPDTDPWFDAERRIGMWRSSLEEEELNVVVADADGSIVGFAATHLTPGADAVLSLIHI